MNPLIYLIQVNLYLVLFYGLYHLILRNETFFKMNRLYLVGSTLLALAIPLLKAEWVKDLFVTEQIYHATQQVSNTVSTVMLNEPIVVGNYTAVQSDGITAGQAFWILYGIITLLFLVNFLRKLYFVNRALNHKSKYQAFSFFNKVVVDDNLQGNKTIMDHEMVHVRQWHSLDVIFFELFAAFNWFNPISFIYKKAIKNIHEFIADETAASTLEDKSEYALLLVSNAFGTQPHKLTNSFYNNSLLKTRLIMLNKNKSRKTAILKYGLSVPLFAVMIILSSATIEKSQTINQIAERIEKTMPAIVESVTDGKIIIPKSDVSPVVQSDKTAAIKEENSPQAAGNVIGGINTTEDERLQLLYTYFIKNIKYPPTDNSNNNTGDNFVKFELDEVGKISNPVFIKTMSPTMKAEIERVISAAPTFGDGIAGKYIQPVLFRLSNTGFGDLKNSMPGNPGEYKLLKPAIIRGYTKVSRAENMQAHLSQFSISVDLDNPKEGIVVIAFDVPKDKIPVNYRVVKSLGFDWEGPLVAHMKLFRDTVVLAEGTYSFYEKITLGEDEWKKVEIENVPPVIFGHGIANSFSHTISDETKKDAGRIVDYIKAPYLKNPVILLDGKIAKYSNTAKGFQLDETLYPKKVTVKVYRGDKAVANYNETARETGLIVVTTKEK
ncbi:MAG: M56 family metallopeptidase [Bacteroidota bacterium]